MRIMRIITVAIPMMHPIIMMIMTTMPGIAITSTGQAAGIDGHGEHGHKHDHR